jgi:hypothetical protein
MKTEYRAAYYGRGNTNELFDATGLLVGRDIAFKPLVQTISTSRRVKLACVGTGCTVPSVGRLTPSLAGF